MKYKAIIFDMDGTIIDTEHIWKQATKELIQTRNIDVHPEIAEYIETQTHGLAAHKSCALIKEALKLPEPVEFLVKEKTKRALELYREQLRFINGFSEFHKMLHPLNLKSGVATNADNETIDVTNSVLNLTNYFGKHIYGIECVNFICKPDPAIYLHAAEQLQVNPAECMAIEDSAHGVHAAKKAGMFCIGINTAGKKENLKQADLIVDSYQEIALPILIKK